MITIRLPIKINEEVQDFIKSIQRQQSSVIRWAFKRVNEGLSQKEIRDLSKNLNNVDLLDSWFIQSAIISAQGLSKAVDGKKVIFGGKNTFKLRRQGLINCEEWKEKRLMPIHLEGESPYCGNRKLHLDLDNNQIIFTPKRGIKFNLQFPKVKKNYWLKLKQLEELCKERLCPFTVDLTSNMVCLSFELNESKRLKSIVKRAYTEKSTRDKARKKLEELEKHSLKNSSRILGIDQNPNFIGLSIIEFNKDDEFQVLYKQVIDFSELNKKSGEASCDPKSIYVNNKKKFELIEACKYVVNLAKHWNCGKISIEDLSFKGSRNQGIGRGVNRLCNNVWHRGLLHEQLVKRCAIAQIEFVKVNAAYSSTIGNINHGNEKCPDMIASSIEIARRAHKKFTKGWFYPTFKNIENLKNLWKEETDFSSWSWIEIHQKIKESKVKYRFLLKESIPNAVFSIFHKKSRLILHQFI